MRKPRTREERILLMSSIYQYDIYQDEGFMPSFEDEALLDDYQQIIKAIKAIDEIIEKHLYNYRLQRLSYVDRAIIRLAVFEMKEGLTAGPVAINEAIELTKIYTNLDDEKQHKFNNKLLDTIYQSIKE
jgi:transcription antitermination protein NusB